MSSLRTQPALPLLVVDDEPVLLELICAVLEEEGFAVLTARNGSEALAIAQQTPLALVLTDFMMPGMNGIDLALQLRADLQTAMIPMLLMSAALPADESGLFVDVIHKPFLLEDLLANVYKWLQ